MNHTIFLLIALFPLVFSSIDYFDDVFADTEYSSQNISLRSHLTNNSGMTADTFWTILNEDKGTLVTSSNNGVIVIRFDFQDHEKCYDTPDTFCLIATITETKNSYFIQVGDQATIILEFPDKLTFSVLSGALVTNTFDLDILKMTEINTPIDNLPSWNSGDSKQKIIEFVNQVTDSSSSSFVPIEDRIATFDNDGTLWIEQPLYIPFSFHIEYLYEQLDDDPSLVSTSPYSEIIVMGDSITNKDLEHIPDLMDILLPAYPNITQNEYLQKSKDYLDNTNHPRFNVALKELTYQPMVELVHYLQQNDFDVYIVSAGFQGMMQAVSEEIYNIEKENVIGTHPEFISQLTEQGTVQIRQPTLGSFNDGAEKPVNIEKVIGKTPIFACGNSGGDVEMLMLTQNHENHFACMLDHDDESREYYYPNQEALDESQKNGWTVISMKNDFKTVFSNSQKEIIVYECSSDFWKDNLDLWENVGLDYNDDFDETFGKDNFDPDITLEQAISMEGLGLNHLARSGTIAYLNALVDPEIDEEKVRSAIYFGYVHQIDKYLDNCKNIEKLVLLN